VDTWLIVLIVIAAVIALGLLLALIQALPDLWRYIRIRMM
jgi:hypothetical protein